MLFHRKSEHKNISSNDINQITVTFCFTFFFGKLITFFLKCVLFELVRDYKKVHFLNYVIVRALLMHSYFICIFKLCSYYQHAINLQVLLQDC